MKKTLLFTLVLINTFCSCDKNNNVTPQYNTPKNNTIKIGHDSNMIVNEIDTIFSSFLRNDVAFDIDIDGNSKNDIVFEIIVRAGGIGYGDSYSIWIEGLNDKIIFLGEYKTDTSFLNKDISVYGEAPKPTVIDTIYNFTCNRMSANDSILEINENTFKITALDYGETIDSLNIFTSKKIKLCENSYHSRPIWIDMQDTIIASVHNQFNDCNNFPIDEEKYIGIKTIKEGSVKYGWLKIKIVSTYGGFYNQLELIEAAIQK